MGALLDGQSEVTAAPVCTLEVSDRPLPVPDRDPDEASDVLRAWWGGSDLALDHSSGLRAVADARDARIGGDTDRLRVPFRYLFQPLITHVLAHRDRFVVHAAAMATDEGAFLVLGETGSGKSTLALAALRQGWQVLGDDLVVIRPGDGAGPPEVTGIRRPLAVPADVLGEVGDARMMAGDPRSRAELPLAHLTTGWWPVRGLLLVGHGSAPGGGLLDVPGVDAFRVVVGSYYAASNPPLLRRFFRHAAALSRVPAWRFELASDPAGRLVAAGRHLDAAARRGGTDPT